MNTPCSLDELLREILLLTVLKQWAWPIDSNVHSSVTSLCLQLVHDTPKKEILKNILLYKIRTPNFCPKRNIGKYFPGLGSAIGPSSYIVAASYSTTVLSLVIYYASMLMIHTSSQNYQSPSAELDHIETWAACNNLYILIVPCVLNWSSQSFSLIYRHVCLLFSDITWRIKILSVTITSKMPVSEHVRSITNSCAQTIHAIRIHRSRGIDDAQLELIYRAVVIANLILYASSSW